MTTRRTLATLIAVCALLAGAWLLFLRPPPPRQAVAPVPQRLVATVRGDPRSFNRYADRGFPTHLVNLLTEAPLVRINRIAGDLEPWLADRWTRSDDGLRYHLHLRDAAFSDGRPFTADDVVFSLAAVYDPHGGSALRGSLTVGGQPIAARALSPHDVEIVMPAPYGPGLRLLDTLPIYPRHALATSLSAGLFAKAWGTATAPGRMVGLGPFVLDAYEPGQRIVLTRNPHYWRRDAQGRRLPYLDRLTLAVVQDQNTELLRLRAGEVDLLQNELRPEDYLPLKQDADAGRVRLDDVGTSLDLTMLWANLTAAEGDDSRPWLRRDELRQAITHAVDRRQFARAVYLGAADPAWSVVSPANTAWYDASIPAPAYDPARARALLAAIGLQDRNGDRRLEDAQGAPARFSVLVQKGVSASEKGAATLREALDALGLGVDVVALDFAALMTRWQKGDYDFIYHFVQATDTDPAGNLDFWLSSGDGHMWNPVQPQPATAWEREVDGLMQRQASALDPDERVRLFAEVQRLFAEHVPVIVFAVPHVYVASSTRVTGLTPGVQRPQVLWNPDMLAVTR